MVRIWEARNISNQQQLCMNVFFICDQAPRIEPCHVQFAHSLQTNVILTIASANYYPRYLDV